MFAPRLFERLFERFELFEPLRRRPFLEPLLLFLLLLRRRLLLLPLPLELLLLELFELLLLPLLLLSPPEPFLRERLRRLRRRFELPELCSS